MVKQKAFALSLALLASAGLSCDSPTRPPTTGGISIVLLSSESGLRMAVRSPNSASTPDVTTGPNAMANVTLDGVRVTVSGPTPKTTTVTTATGGFFNVSITDLTPGSYSVAVEGLVGGEVANFGQTTGVSVSAGNNTPATITFPSFQPVIPASTVVDTADVLHFTVSWNAVSGATSYVVAWSTNQNMSGATTKTVTSSPTDIQVTSEGKYFVTVRAVNSVVTTGGVASAPKGVYAFQGVATVTVTPAGPTISVGGTQQLAAEARDADNVIVPNVTWLWISDKQSVATVSQSGLATAVSPGTATIVAVGKGMPGSTTLTVNSPPAAKLAFITQPANATAAQSISSVLVAVQSAQGATLTSDNATQVTLAIGTNAGGGTLSGTATATVANGVATFNSLSINKSGTGYTLSAAASGLTGSTSDQFNVVAGAATKLTFSIQPTSSIAGDPLSPAVQIEVRDANDNLVTTSRDAVTVAIGVNPSTGGAGVLTGTKVVNAINGIASFSGLWINKTGNGYTLASSATGLTGSASSAFNISPAAASKLAFSQQPSNVQGAVAMAPAVTVTITDQFDNPTAATNAVTLSLASNPWKTPFASGATLAGGASTPAVSGTATFAGVRVDKPTGGYNVAATAAGLTGALSSNFRVSLAFTSLSIASGGIHTCGKTAGGLYCWGYNGYGQLGGQSGSFNQDSIASLVVSGQNFASVYAGAYHTCAITTSNDAYCWGANFQGQLGNGSTSGSANDVPTLVSGGHKFSALALGYGHTCGITTASVTAAEDRQVYCWGYNAFGQSGDGGGVIGTPTNYTTPHQVVAGPLQTAHATQISSGFYHVCAIASGTAYCWGSDGNGQLGDDVTLAHKTTPTVVAGAWTSIAAGSNHTCGILADNTARCWGYNFYGQLGDGGNTQQPTPVVLANVVGIQWGQISAGGVHTCAVTTGGAGYCWGYNGDGRLGDDNAPANSNTRSAVAGSLTFLEIRTGDSHSCGRTATGVYCWGDNSSGQLGNIGTNNFKKAPNQIVQ